MSDPKHLFVYGILRPESLHPMARRLRIGARHVGKGSVPGVLYDLGYYPAAFFREDARARVQGDVFELKPDGKLLALLDDYEGTGRFYHRLVLEIALAKGGSIRAWAYGVGEPLRARLIGSGDFIAHVNARKRRASGA
jgi:gamma-glutamylcyclotransferase (GGCT)/AIG2-like uncharacterized protein YtfP